MRSRTTTDRERFDGKWIPEPNTGCWLWTGPVSKDGYGQFKMSHFQWKAHRASWQMYRGEIPPGMQIDHICRVRSCVNPDHLRVVTQRTNVLENSIGLAAQNLSKTHCPRGHPLSGKNLRTVKNAETNSRRCRTCHNAKIAARRAALKQETAPRTDTPLDFAALLHRHF